MSFIFNKTKPSFAYQWFFLFGAAWAALHFVFWLPSFWIQDYITGDYTAIFWHAHEMLFGFGGAILAGFLLTVIPNWTGTLPFSRNLIFSILLIWFAGRIVMIGNTVFGAIPTVLVDLLFLPTVAIIILIPILKEQKWHDLKVLGGLTLLITANSVFHYQVIVGGDIVWACRLGASAFCMLVIIVGGRMIPAYMKQAFSENGRINLIPPHNIFDTITIIISIISLGLWVSDAFISLIATFAFCAALLQSIRLLRWHIFHFPYPWLLAGLIIGYSFIVLAFLAIAFSALDILPSLFPIHIITIGVMSLTMVAVMMRLCSRYHAVGQSLAVKLLIIFFMLILSLVLRISAEFFIDAQLFFYILSACFYALAFILYVILI